MKIAMIGQKGIAIGAGGVERHVEEIAKRLVQDGHEVTVYYRDTFIKVNMKEYKGIKLKQIKTFESKSLDAIVYSFKSTIDALIGNYDVYHYHALGPASLSFIPKLFGKKVVVTVHGLDWQRGKWGKFAKLYLKFGEFICGTFANKLIVVSDNLKKYFIKKYKKRNESNTVFIPNGVNHAEKLEAKLIKQYKLEKDSYILFLARLVPEKGAHYLIQAYQKLNIETKLVIAGGSSFTDNYLEELHNIAKKNENILFTGSVSGAILYELYSNCLFYILPSDLEGMPLSILEALSYGKYCLVSDIEENKNVITSELLGTTFIKSNDDDLKNKIKKVVDEKLYLGDEENRRRYVEELYNWDNIENETFLVYDELFKGADKENEIYNA